MDFCIEELNCIGHVLQLEETDYIYEENIKLLATWYFNKVMKRKVIEIGIVPLLIEKIKERSDKNSLVSYAFNALCNMCDGEGGEEVKKNIIDCQPGSIIKFIFETSDHMISIQDCLSLIEKLMNQPTCCSLTRILIYNEDIINITIRLFLRLSTQSNPSPNLTLGILKILTRLIHASRDSVVVNNDNNSSDISRRIFALMEMDRQLLASVCSSTGASRPNLRSANASSRAPLVLASAADPTFVTAILNGFHAAVAVHDTWHISGDGPDFARLFLALVEEPSLAMIYGSAGGTDMVLEALGNRNRDLHSQRGHSHTDNLFLCLTRCLYLLTREPGNRARIRNDERNQGGLKIILKSLISILDHVSDGVVTSHYVESLDRLALVIGILRNFGDDTSATDILYRNGLLLWLNKSLLHLMWHPAPPLTHSKPASVGVIVGTENRDYGINSALSGIETCVDPSQPTNLINNNEEEVVTLIKRVNGDINQPTPDAEFNPQTSPTCGFEDDCDDRELSSVVIQDDWGENSAGGSSDAISDFLLADWTASPPQSHFMEGEGDEEIDDVTLRSFAATLGTCNRIGAVDKVLNLDFRACTICTWPVIDHPHQYTLLEDIVHLVTQIFHRHSSDLIKKDIKILGTLLTIFMHARKPVPKLMSCLATTIFKPKYFVCLLKNRFPLLIYKYVTALSSREEIRCSFTQDPLLQEPRTTWDGRKKRGRSSVGSFGGHYVERLRNLSKKGHHPNLLPCFVECPACDTKLALVEMWLALIQKLARPRVLTNLKNFVVRNANRKDPYIRGTLQTAVTCCYLSLPFVFNRKHECHVYFESVKYAQNISAISRAYATVARDLGNGGDCSAVGEALLSTYIRDVLNVAHYLAVGMEEGYDHTLVSRTMENVYSGLRTVRDLGSLKNTPRGVMNNIRGYDLDLSIGSVRTVPAPAPGTVKTSIYHPAFRQPHIPSLPSIDITIRDRFSYASLLAKSYLYILDPSRLPFECLDAIKNRYFDTSSSSTDLSRYRPNYEKSFITPTIELTAKAPGYSRWRRPTPIHEPDRHHGLCLPRNFLCLNSPVFGCMLMRGNFRERGLKAVTICDTWYDHLRFWAILAYSLPTPRDNRSYPPRPHTAVSRAETRAGPDYHKLHLPLAEIYTIAGPTTDDAKEVVDQLFHVVDVHLGAYALAHRFLMGDLERRLRRDLIPDLYTVVHVCIGNLEGDSTNPDPGTSCGGATCPCDLFEEIVGTLSRSGFAEAVHDFVERFITRLPLLLWSGTGRSPTSLTIDQVLEHFVHHLLSLGCPAVEDFLNGILRCVVGATKNLEASYEEYRDYMSRVTIPYYADCCDCYHCIGDYDDSGCYY